MRTVSGKLELTVAGGREVWFAESHHMVLKAWAAHRKGRDAPPHLITFDFHTDLRKAFTADCCSGWDWKSIPGPEDGYAHMKPLVAELATLDEAKVKEMIGRLTYEEHIDAAQRAGIVDAAILCLSERPGIDPEPELRQFAVWIDTWERSDADAALEPGFLAGLVDTVREVTGKGIEELDYILDVDLDYFRTAKAIAPDDPSMFRTLIRHAGLITVALEPECVIGGRFPGETIDAQGLFSDLLGHVAAAGAP
jgi:hypothetical protein